MYTVDIDVGGTLTDGLFSDGTSAIAVKVDTTPHDLTVCFKDCLTAGAERLGFDDLSEFLNRVDLIRWSTTITTNVLAERRGPKLGLFVSDGHERDLYAQNGPSPALGTLVDDVNVIGFARPIDTTTVLRAVKRLLENGVRRICVSLDDAFQDASDERLIKRTIDAQYPDHYLGSVPVLRASDISHYPDDMTRTHHALINSYVHGPLATSLYKAEDDLRAAGYTRPLFIAHANGGVARVAKTKALDTLESGPTMGMFAAGYFARQYDLDQVITVDVGGTTTKVGIIQDGRPVQTSEVNVFGVPVHAPAVLVRSIALGGGSVVKVDPETDRLQIGPESMGAYPGPACYDLGGTNPTLTDAFVTIKWLDPDYFMGGERQLNVERAHEVITEHVAEPLGISLEAAAVRIVETAFDDVAQVMTDTLDDVGWNPAECTLFAFGGNGPIFAAGVAEQVGIDEAYVFDLGPVLSAFGSSTSDIVHVYEHGLDLALDETDAATRLAEVVRPLRDQALRDMKGEGIAPDSVNLHLELKVARNGEAPARVEVPVDTVVNGELEGIGAEHHDGTVQLVRLQATHRIPHFEPTPQELHTGEPTEAVKARRSATWRDGTGDTTVYDWDGVRPGHTVAGAAILESDKSTYLVPPHWTLSRDEFGNGKLTKTATA